MMDQALIESMKGKSKEERAEYFRNHKAELLSAADLKSVNGGATTNPKSEMPYDGYYWTSWWYVCNGDHFCK